MKKAFIAVAILLLSVNAGAWSNTATMDSKPNIGTDWWGQDRVANGSEIVTDTTPFGSSNVLQFNYPAGWTNQGQEPATYWNVFSGETNELWVQYHVKYSTNYEWHPVGDKQIYVNVGVGLKWIYVIAAHGNLEIRTQGDMGNQNKGQNIGSTVTLAGGQYYKIKIRFVMNSAGSYNGIGEMWVNDTKIMSHSDLGFGNNGHGFDEVDITPVYGGIASGSKTQTDYQRYDNFYAGTVAPDGSTTPVLISPGNAVTGLHNPVTFSWGAISGAVLYELQVATDVNFSNIVSDVTTASTSYQSTVTFDGNITYYWRVRAGN